MVFIVVGVVQVAVAVAFYIRKLRKKAEEDAGQNTDQRMLHLLLHRCADGGGAFVTAGVAVGARPLRVPVRVHARPPDARTRGWRT